MIKEDEALLIGELSKHKDIILDYSRLFNSTGEFSDLKKPHNIYINYNFDYNKYLINILKALSIDYNEYSKSSQSSGFDYEEANQLNIIIGYNANISSFNIIFNILNKIRKEEAIDTVESDGYYYSYKADRVIDSPPKFLFFMVKSKHNNPNHFNRIVIGGEKDFPNDSSLIVTSLKNKLLSNFFSNHSPEEVYQLGMWAISQYDILGGEGKLAFEYKKDRFYSEPDDYSDDDRDPGGWDKYIPHYDDDVEDGFDGISDAQWNVD